MSRPARYASSPPVRSDPCCLFRPLSSTILAMKLVDVSLSAVPDSPRHPTGACPLAQRPARRACPERTVGESPPTGGVTGRRPSCSLQPRNRSSRRQATDRRSSRATAAVRLPRIDSLSGKRSCFLHRLFSPVSPQIRRCPCRTAGADGSFGPVSTMGMTGTGGGTIKIERKDRQCGIISWLASSRHPSVPTLCRHRARVARCGSQSEIRTVSI